MVNVKCCACNWVDPIIATLFRLHKVFLFFIFFVHAYFYVWYFGVKNVWIIKECLGKVCTCNTFRNSTNHMARFIQGGKKVCLLLHLTWYQSWFLSSMTNGNKIAPVMETYNMSNTTNQRTNYAVRSHFSTLVNIGSS